MSQIVESKTPGIDHDAEVGRRVFHLMWDRKITQTAMAERLGLQQSALSKKLRGERRWFVSDLITVADVLDVTVGQLVGETQKAPTPKSEGQWLPELDSNQQPAGFMPGELIHVDFTRAKVVA